MAPAVTRILWLLIAVAAGAGCAFSPVSTASPTTSASATTGASSSGVTAGASSAASTSGTTSHSTAGTTAATATAGATSTSGATTAGATSGTTGTLSMQPQIQPDRTALAFGSEWGEGVYAGTTPVETLQLLNAGQQPLVISSATLTGTSAASFAVDQTYVGQSIASGQVAFVQVTLAMAVIGTPTASLQIASNAENTPALTVPLTATIVADPTLPSGGTDDGECFGTHCERPEIGTNDGTYATTWVAYGQDTTLSYLDDVDGDGIADALDNCRYVPNPDQLDSDGDNIGDVCDPDLDGDGVPDKVLLTDTSGRVIGSAPISASDGGDNCPLLPNANQLITCVVGNTNCAGYVAPIGDACNPDIDNDGIPNAKDDCPFYADPSQNGRSVLPQNEIASLCDGVDTDGDGIPDYRDNCVYVPNPEQSDINGNGIGDLCDADEDGDAIPDQTLVLDAQGNVTGSNPIPVQSGGDDCPTVGNYAQIDSTHSGIGDACRTGFCFIVNNAQPSECLDPHAPFTVNAGVETSATPGSLIRLPVLANRNGRAFSFAWSVVSAPNGSAAAIANPTGAVTASRRWQYAYPFASPPTFTPDVAGAYTLQLSATLVLPDALFPSVTTSTAQLSLTAQ